MACQGERFRIRESVSCACALLAVTPRYLTYAVSGMETPLYVAAILASLWGYGAGRTAAALTCGVATMLRPDGLLLAAALAVHRMAVRRRLPLREGAIFAATVLPWVLFATWYFGNPVPTSVLAKTDQAASPLLSLRYLIGYFTDTRPFLALSAVAVVGLATVLLRRPRFGPWLLWTLWAAAYAAAFTLTGAFGDFPWYYTPLLPLFFALAGVGAVEAARAAATGVPRLEWQRPASHLAVGGAVTLAVLALTAVTLPRHGRTLEAWANTREALYRRVAEDIEARGGRDELVAASEIGAVGYFHRGPVLDLVGLVSPEAIGRSDRDTLLEARPAWLVSYDSHLDPALPDDPCFRARYETRWSYQVADDRSLLVFERRQPPIEPAAPQSRRAAP